MPAQRPLSCPWCDCESSDGESFRVHLMVEHRKSKLAGFVERRVTDERPRELVAR